MAWHPPTDWTSNQLVRAQDLNEQIRDNTAYLKKRPFVAVNNPGFTITTNSSNYSYVGNGMTVTFTPEPSAAGRCLYMVGFGGHLYSNVPGSFQVAIEINSTINNDFFRVINRTYAANMVQSFSWTNARWMSTGSPTQLRVMWKSLDGATFTSQNGWYLWALDISEE